MKRLQLTIEDELYEDLEWAARREGVSKSVVVRRCIKSQLEPRPSLKDDPFFQMIGTLTEEGKGLRPGESIDDIVYGRKADRRDFC